MTNNKVKEQLIRSAPMCLACASLFAYIDLGKTKDIIIDQCAVCGNTNYVSSEWWPITITNSIIRSEHLSLGAYQMKTQRSTNLPHIPPAEMAVARLVAAGLSNRDIAKKLDKSEQTVKNSVSVTMRRVGAHNRVELTLMLHGIIPYSTSRVHP